MKKLFFVRLLATSAGLWLTSGLLSAALAQAPGSTGPTPAPQAPTEVPLDGGAALLLAGGVGYGLRRLRQRAT